MKLCFAARHGTTAAEKHPPERVGGRGGQGLPRRRRDQGDDGAGRQAHEDDRLLPGEEPQEVAPQEVAQRSGWIGRHGLAGAAQTGARVHRFCANYFEIWHRYVQRCWRRSAR